MFVPTHVVTDAGLAYAEIGFGNNTLVKITDEPPTVSGASIPLVNVERQDGETTELYLNRLTELETKLLDDEKPVRVVPCDNVHRPRLSPCEMRSVVETVSGVYTVVDAERLSDIPDDCLWPVGSIVRNGRGERFEIIDRAVEYLERGYVLATPYRLRAVDSPDDWGWWLTSHKDNGPFTLATDEEPEFSDGDRVTCFFADYEHDYGSACKDPVAVDEPSFEPTHVVVDWTFTDAADELRSTLADALQSLADEVRP